MTVQACLLAYSFIHIDSRHKMKTASATIAILLTAFLTVSSQENAADNVSDWNQILGPNRNGAIDSSAIPDWDGKPEVQWQKEIGDGFAGPVISNGFLILFHRPKSARNSLVVEKLDAESGQSIWKQNIETAYNGEMDGDRGPKSTPVINDGHIYCYGPDGKLACLSFEDGKIVWELNARQKYKARRGYFGCGSTPIVIGKNVLVNVGGREASIVAFDKKTGNEVWKAINDEASYSSPVAVTFRDRTVAVFLTRTRFVGIEPDSGKVLFSNAFGKKGPTAVASMPVVNGSQIFANAAYGVGAMTIDLKDALLDGGEVAPIWSDRSAFASHYGTPVFHKGHIYGTTGREDMRNGSFRCIEAATGKVKWDKPSFPVAHTLAFRDHMLVLDHQGGLHVIEFSSKEFKSVQSTKAFSGPTRAVPAYSNGKLYFRSNAQRGVGKLIALQVTKPKE